MRKNLGAKPYTYPQPVFIVAAYGPDGTPDAAHVAECGYLGVVPANNVPDKLAPITLDPINSACHVLGDQVGSVFLDGLKLK